MGKTENRPLPESREHVLREPILLVTDFRRERNIQTIFNRASLCYFLLGSNFRVGRRYYCFPSSGSLMPPGVIYKNYNTVSALRLSKKKKMQL